MSRSVSLIGDAPQFQPQFGGSQLFKEIARASQGIADDLQAKADIEYTNTFLSDARKTARKIYNDNLDDPAQLEKELVNYKQGLLKNMPSRLRPVLNNQYDTISGKYLEKSQTTLNKQMTVRQEIALNEYENQVLSDLSFSASELFSVDPRLSEDENKVKNLTSIDAIAVDFDSLEKNLTQVGADGRMLKTPEQVAKSIEKAKNIVFTEGAKAYIRNNPDKLEAYGKWLNNEAILDLPEGRANLREGLNPDVRRKVDEQLLEELKNELYIEKQQIDRLEKEEEAFQDETQKLLFDLSVQGQLTPAIAEANRNILEFDDYKDFVQISREDNPTTNGLEYGKFVNQIDNGVDISDQLRVARFTNRTLSNQDYERLLDKNKAKGGKGAVPTGVEAGRDFLLGTLGSNSELLDITQSAVIAGAEREYDSRVQDFVDSEGRQPNRKESLEISDEVTERYNLIQLEEYSATLPKPKFMPTSMKVRGEEQTTENLERVKEDTRNFFLKKYDGDIEQAKQDPELIQELKSIQKFELVIQAKEQKKRNR